MANPEKSDDPWEERQPGFLLGLTVGFMAFAQLLIDKGILDHAEVTRALIDAAPDPSDVPHAEVAKLWLEATSSNLGPKK